MTTNYISESSPMHHRLATRKRAEQSLGARAGLMDDAIERYSRAVEDEMRLRDAYADLEHPVTELGGANGRVVVAHPLIETIAKAAAAAAKLAEAVGLGAAKSNAGRPTGAVSAPDRASEPPRIRRVR